MMSADTLIDEQIRGSRGKRFVLACFLGAIFSAIWVAVLHGPKRDLFAMLLLGGVSAFVLFLCVSTFIFVPILKFNGVGLSVESKLRSTPTYKWSDIKSARIYDSVATYGGSHGILLTFKNADTYGRDSVLISGLWDVSRELILAKINARLR